MTGMQKLGKVTRVEVINNSGRALVTYGASEVFTSLQDDERTLKVFYNTEESSRERIAGPSLRIPSDDDTLSAAIAAGMASHDWDMVDNMGGSEQAVKDALRTALVYLLRQGV